MGLPRMTPLQALVVNILFGGERSSRQIHEELAFHGVEMKMPLVYRMLGRLELAAYVCGRYRQYQMADGRTIRERHYRVSETGLKQWEQTVAFYRSMHPPQKDFRPVPMAEFGEDDEFDESHAES